MFDFSDFDKLFKQQHSELQAKTDIKEDDTAYTFVYELAGFKKEDIDIETRGDMLQIKAEKKQEKDDSDTEYHRQERTYGMFSYSASLPEDADVDAIDATFENGVLSVRIPKKAGAKLSSNKVNIR